MYSKSDSSYTKFNRQNFGFFFNRELEQLDSSPEFLAFLGLVKR